MQKWLHNRIRFVLRLSAALLLVCALLPGCASPRANQDALTDEGAPPETTALSGADATQVLPRSTIAPRPVQELLPDGEPFAAMFVNVGKADACILRFGSSAVLIDTGSADSIPQLIAGLNLLGITKIDAVFVTHSHSDHLGGLDALAANYDISIVYSPYFIEKNKDGDGKIASRADKLRLKHTELRAGERISLAGSVTFDVLGPLAQNEENDNDNSLVLRLNYDGKTILFAGDMQFSEEQALIASGMDFAADVLKVGNHGNPDATGGDFAALASPSVAVISTDTAEDADSANSRVFAALPKSDIYVTQDFPLGVLVTLDAADNIVVSNPAREMTSINVSLSADVKNQSVTLANDGAADADLSGCVLFSADTGATLRIPEGTILMPGGSLTIGKGNPLSFPGVENPLRKKKSNTVELFDSYGNLIGEWTD